MASRDDAYGTIRLPEQLIARVERFVESNDWGYRTKAEVVAAALREFLQRHEPKPPV